MTYWNGKVYVGTNRAYGCVAVWEFVVQTGSSGYPPSDRDQVCPPSPADIPEAAQIWSLDPSTNTWSLAYQSPLTDASGNCVIPNQSYPGKCLPPDQGFRTVADYVDSSGTDALYFGGVSTEAMGFNKSPQVPPPRLIYTTDGVNFRAVPQDAGTVMGSLIGASLRSLTSYNGQLFVVSGSVQGNGPIFASSNPAAGDNAWQLVSPPGVSFYDMQPFNGWLYVGTTDTVNGYSVLKTQATGPAPYQFQTVVPPGAFVTPSTGSPAQSVVSMHVFNGRLYVGTADPSELIRINPDDTWDLVVGAPRLLPDGSWKYPLSGLGKGFSNDLNLHIWRMSDHNGQLFAGTYDFATRWKNNPSLALQMVPQMGFDLYGTNDGWYFDGITTNGFADPYDYGVRNMVDTPYGLFLGTANEYYGLDVYRAAPDLSRTTTFPPGLPPARLQVEMNQQQPVLSWDPVSFAATYHVYRSTIQTFNLPAQPPFNNGGPANTPGPYVEITAPTGTPDTVYIDAPMSGGAGYLYSVLAQDANGNATNASNIVVVPAITPPPTFTSALAVVNQLQQRGRFASPSQFSAAQQAIQQAQSLAARGDYPGAFDQLKSIRAGVLAGSVVQAPDSSDLEILLEQLSRRIKLAQIGLVDPSKLS